MTPFVEGLTQAAVITFYAAAFAVGLIAHWHTRLWARKLSTVGIMAASAGWLYFYLVIANATLSTAPMVVLWSRVFHYNNATWLFIMALVIRRADRYGIELALSREHHG